MNTFVIYNVESTREVSYHETLRGAKISLAAVRRNNPSRTFDVADYATYRDTIVKKVMVRNIMTDKMVEEYSNTPYGCSVASESYWSR
jgi:hypothetical protein